MNKILYIFIPAMLFSTYLMGQQNETFKFKSSISAQDYEEGTIVIKLKSQSTISSQSKKVGSSVNKVGLEVIEKELRSLKIKSSSRPFPDKQQKSLRMVAPKVDLSDIYIVRISAEQNLESAINSLRQNENIEYAEPYYNHKLFLIPNDPKANPTSGIQYFLEKVKAFDAWNVQRGDSNIVIGIIDTGVLFDHQDLSGNIKYNFLDPINNIDDDNDGYIDNFRGWDFADKDNEPIADKSGHGTEVTGASNGYANNGIGIVGTSYNSKFLPLKVFRSSDNRFSMGFEAIKYAADRGCKVINLSWGGEGGLSKYEQNIIDYAVLEKDVVIIAAAGNTPEEVNFYPASYNNVLSVAATDKDDKKTSFSTFNNKVDISAPGDYIGTTSNAGIDQYSQVSGTSLAAPIVAGAAALVRAKFPHYNALQVMEQLRVTADDIYSIPGNATYKEKLGKGRLNIYRALTDTLSPSVRLVSHNIQNGNPTLAFYGDTIKIFCDFKNYLIASKNLKVTLSSTSGFVEIVKGEFFPGHLGKLESKNNYLSPFEVYLSENTPSSQKIEFKLTFEDGNYNDFQYFDIYTAPEYLEVDVNNIAMTTTSKGRLGFQEKNDSQNSNLYGTGGIMFATSPLKVSNNVISNFSTGQSDQNLTYSKGIKYFKETYADIETRGMLVDSINNPDKIGLVVTQKQYGWKTSPDNSSVILEYFVTNNSGATLSNLYSGLFADWNIDSYNENRAEWDEENKFGYVYSSKAGNKMVAVALLTAGTPIYYALDHSTDNGNGIILTDGFTKSEKYKTLSNGVTYNKAGMNGYGSDVSQVIGMKVETIPNKSSFRLAYAVVFGNSLEELKNAISMARAKFDEYHLNPATSLSLFYCSNSPATIKRSNNKSFNIYGELPLSSPIYSGSEYTTPPLKENRSYYITHTEDGFESEPSKVALYSRNVVADFSMNLDTLDLLKGNKVTFTSRSEGAVRWNWEFDNGYKSTNKNVTRVFNRQGSYQISLVVENSSGCTDTLSKKLVVISTSPKPIVDPVYVCKGGNGEITPINGTSFNFYNKYPLETPISSGKSLSLTNVTSAQTYWVTNLDSLFESEPLKVKVNIWENFAKFSTVSDTIDLDEQSTLKVTDQTEGSIEWTWVSGNQAFEGASQAYFTFSRVGVYSISLKVVNLSGCTEIVSKQIVAVRKTPTPKEIQLRVCSKDSINVPFNSSNLRFFSSYPDKIISEGSSLKTTGISSQQIFYVTSLDSLLESSPAKVTVNVSEANAKFSVSKDTVYLNEDNSNQFISLSKEAVSWLWDFGNGQFSSEAIANTIYTAPGTYRITLSTTNDNGCTSSELKEIVVVDSKRMHNLVSIYPNPTNEFIIIKASLEETGLVDIHVLNSHGEEMDSVEKHQLGERAATFNVANYPIGVYFVKIKNQKESIISKILLTR